MLKKICTFFVLAAAIATLSAENYTITFSGIGAASNVESVGVVNMRTGFTLTVTAGNTLLLTNISTGISDGNSSDGHLRVYSNPSLSNVSAKYYSDRSGEAAIEVLDALGHQLALLHQKIDAGTNVFDINGLSCGIYVINVKAFGKCSVAKVISKSNSQNNINIIFTGTDHGDNTGSINNLKSAHGQQSMSYTPGDWLMFRGKSGINTTYVVDDPTGNKTITFNFSTCTDGDNNNYPVVVLGSQTWMASNLKTTKYNDGVSIPSVTGETSWTLLNTPAYCWYNNDAGIYNKTTYGGLYNWYAVDVTSTGGKNVCPSGWHVPTDEEWSILETTLGGSAAAGAKMKETGTMFWTDPNNGATNRSGFSGMPTGHRTYNNGTFVGKGNGLVMWSATTDSGNNLIAWQRSLSYSTTFLSRLNNSKKNGFSVRCVKD